MKRTRDVFGLLGLVFGAVGAMRQLREARGKKDRLALVHAMVNITAVVTGGALAVRSMRGKDGEES
ncbi:MAG TPA: hypothetical protein VHV49_08980 [Pseudonocardiaceae bacterium]|jgi:hypothetical protein|nr:hypothetical protein [Pseudonocardiaceae bacterium]